MGAFFPNFRPAGHPKPWPSFSLSNGHFRAGERRQEKATLGLRGPLTR